MKVLVLGGCGEEGRTAVKVLARDANVSEVVIGDVNMQVAKQFETELHSDKVSSLYVDVNDHDQLVAKMGEVEIVVNVTGPFYELGLKALKAAIEARRDYIDICDDDIPTQEMLALHGSAEEAGIIAITGIGMCPGLTNVLAKYGADKLDSVDDINICWALSSTDFEPRPRGAGPSMTAYHSAEMRRPNIPQYLDGKLTQVSPLSGSEFIEFPVLGECEAIYVGHPEPVTLPRYIGGVKNVTIKGASVGRMADRKARIQLGLTGGEPINVKGTMVYPRDISVALPGRIPPEPPWDKKDPPPFSGLKVSVKGKRGEQAIEYVYTTLGGDGELSRRTGIGASMMSILTGAPVAIATLMVLRGDIKSKGVFAPEGCLNAKAFLTELWERGFQIEEAVHMRYIIGPPHQREEQQ